MIQRLEKQAAKMPAHQLHELQLSLPLLLSIYTNGSSLLEKIVYVGLPVTLYAMHIISTQGMCGISQNCQVDFC